jgi:predicted aspartyl protease
MSVEVSSSNFPYLSVHVIVGTLRNPFFEFDIEPLVDTGFDGGLTVSKDLIPDSIESIGQSVWRLADETEVAAFAYLGYIKIGQLDAVPAVIIALGEEPLLGRSVTNNFRLIFDHGNQIIVEP